MKEGFEAAARVVRRGARSERAQGRGADSLQEEATTPSRLRRWRKEQHEVQRIAHAAEEQATLKRAG